MRDDVAVRAARPKRTLSRERIHSRLTLALQAILLVGIALALWDRQWLTALVTAAILALTLLPVLLGRRLNVFIPAEIEALTVLFVFASLFLGEVHGYYARFPWWDLLLHTASGFLLGIFGFLFVYILNEKEEIELEMRPAFVALFACLFSIGLGTLWEIFEFGMDVTFGWSMQKSLADTMGDLTVDVVGAAGIALLGYGYLRTKEVDSFLERWIERYLEANARTGKQD